MAQGPPLPDARRRSPPPLRGVGLRGQGSGRRPTPYFAELEPPVEDRPVDAGQASSQPQPAIMVPLGPCPTVAAGEGISGAWIDAGREIDPRVFARACRLRAVSTDMTGGLQPRGATAKSRRAAERRRGSRAAPAGVGPAGPGPCAKRWSSSPTACRGCARTSSRCSRCSPRSETARRVSPAESRGRAVGDQRRPSVTCVTRWLRTA